MVVRPLPGVVEDMHDVHREETEEKQVLEAELMWQETKKAIARGRTSSNSVNGSELRVNKLGCRRKNASETLSFPAGSDKSTLR